MVPFFIDGALRGEYLARQGAGLRMPVADMSGDAVRAAVLRLLDEPSFATNAARLRDEMHALPSPNDLVAAIEQRVTKYRDER